MSALIFTIPSMLIPHPWRRLRDTPHITLRWFKAPGPKGFCRHSTQEIFLRDDLSQAERRAVLLHELEHLAEGPAILGFEAQDERSVSEAAARWLLPIELLAGALAWCYDDEEAAEYLWVDLKTIQTRLTTLTVEESAELNRRLDAAELGYPKF